MINRLANLDDVEVINIRQSHIKQAMFLRIQCERNPMFLFDMEAELTPLWIVNGVHPWVFSQSHGKCFDHDSTHRHLKTSFLVAFVDEFPHFLDVVHFDLLDQLQMRNSVALRHQLAVLPFNRVHRYNRLLPVSN